MKHATSLQKYRQSILHEADVLTSRQSRGVTHEDEEGVVGAEGVSEG